jgi:hypothetical protein
LPAWQAFSTRQYLACSDQRAIIEVVLSGA